MKRSLTIGALLILLLGHAPIAFAAIAFDNSTTNHTASASSATYSFCVGAVSNPITYVAFSANKLALPAVSSVTYGGAPLTASAFTPQSLPTDATVRVYLYYLLNSPTGCNNVVITFTSTVDEVNSQAVSYSGVGSVTTDTHVSGTGTSGTLTTTTTADNSWIVGVFRNNNNGDGTAGSGTTKRAFVAGQSGFYDTNGAKSPAGSYSIISTFGSAQYGGVGVSMSPFVASPASRPFFQTQWW
ncbi:hypothetical protein EDE08_101634 [Bradyrhizobium sp. R2.2-H]|jgi:hypothetical protein|uniref:hypothetical protein n=1 Tax=unclassified Bradyrhizobium TaxID=2631580 RepID=UPI00104A3E14|nr:MULTISPECIES: hypothetical protein [unclassified Bradyrhizobium]TCU78852.1 hypothetical protein EDE10_101635 [Bradyrhizobium sp. Y-H1]TCU80935.1 hypothetical protein EDE08_101634 [Bradyrhizobium sp. R2.2-H]